MSMFLAGWPMRRVQQHSHGGGAADGRVWAPGGAIDFRTFLRCVDEIDRPYAAGGLEQQVVELPPQNYSVAKILKKARLQGPVSGCQNQPKTGYVRRYLQSNRERLSFLTGGVGEQKQEK